ncbi:MAG: D-alanyl-lipoteichoic acid biosynthesis protein DltD [Streptococcaceae bacterium]|jgi:D-alanine transfer protein|nr:D-alanyl-lipoteichoic acid biosynthesis protein DltD [Streptococcaceae bacterium]
MKKHKVLKLFLPLFVAAILACLLLLIPSSLGHHYTKSQLNAAATNPGSRKNFVGYSLKNQALSDKSFLPIMGSSELEKFNSFHPSVFAAKYNLPYTPYLIGMPGTQSLAQYFYLTSVATHMKNRKLMFIISPQWFTPKGLSSDLFDNFVSKGEVYTWLESVNPKLPASQALAKRLIALHSLNSDYVLANAIQKVAKGKDIGNLDGLEITLAHQVWRSEDDFFSSIGTSESSISALTRYQKALPKTNNPAKLQQLAIQEGAKNASNNPFQINNAVWTHKISKSYQKRAGQMKNVSYLQSPEYSDFQQLLNAFAANHDEVEFVIQPVNGKWYDYTGLSQTMLQDFAQKIKTQLTSQGFTHIADFTNNASTSYFIGDTIHFGTVGWLAFDEVMEQYMAKPYSTPHYHLNNSTYLSKNWQQES